MPISEFAPEFPLHGPYSYEQLHALAFGLARAFDSAPELAWHPSVSSVLASGATATVLTLKGVVRGLPARLSFRQRAAPDSRTLHETVVEVQADTSLVRIDVRRGWASGPTLVTGVGAFDAAFYLQGAPRALVLGLLEPWVLEWLVAHHVAQLSTGAARLSVVVDGWLVESRVSSALVRFAAELAERIPGVIEKAVEARARDAGHHDLNRAEAELTAIWSEERASYEAGQHRAGRSVALVLLISVVVVAIAVVLVVTYAK